MDSIQLPLTIYGTEDTVTNSEDDESFTTVKRQRRGKGRTEIIVDSNFCDTISKTLQARYSKLTIYLNKILLSNFFFGRKYLEM